MIACLEQLLVALRSSRDLPLCQAAGAGHVIPVLLIFGDDTWRGGCGDAGGAQHPCSRQVQIHRE